MFTPLAVEIVTIGDELCRGEIVNTNASWMAERLTRQGFHVRWCSSTVDDDADMTAVLGQAARRARVVVCSGGLGPTDDDRTVDVVAALAGVEPVMDDRHRERMVARFAARNFAVTPNNLRQVRVPAGSTVLDNEVGLAPGFHLRFGEADLFFMPGVPREMKSIYERHVEPRLAALAVGAPATARRVWRVAGMGESHVAHRLRGLIDGIPGTTLHYRIQYPENLVTVVVRRPTQAEANATLTTIDADVRQRLTGAIYGTDEDTLQSVIGQRLRARGETLATAESCTGGLIGDLLTDVPGSSQYYLGGVVAYGNQAKRELLGVREETLATHGAVSQECVCEMAEGVRRRFGTAWGLGVSGIAGPGGGTPDKPVGLVHFAIAGPDGVVARQLQWGAERRQVKLLAASAVLNLLHRLLTPERAAMPEPLESGDRSAKRAR
jgi:nicotinamide-nucleotide amidase